MSTSLMSGHLDHSLSSQRLRIAAAMSDARDKTLVSLTCGLSRLTGRMDSVGVTRLAELLSPVRQRHDGHSVVSWKEDLQVAKKKAAKKAAKKVTKKAAKKATKKAAKKKTAKKKAAPTATSM
jgi:hypothetical protein